ncbi:MAG: response regulator transcription factor, partial [Allosphingosinicella sp.]
RQFEILLHVAQHLSSREIGQILGLSPATIDSHIAAALQKLGLSSRREAALRMIELGFASSLPRSEQDWLVHAAHHGGELPSNRHELPRPAAERSSDRPKLGVFWSAEGKGDGSPPKSGMGPVVLRSLLDGFYIILFFAIMSAAAFGMHWIVIRCERLAIDPFVLLVLRWVSYALVVLDGAGVVTATALLTYRFIRAAEKAG